MGLFAIIKRNSRLALKGAWMCAAAIVLIISGAFLLIYVLRHVAITVFVNDTDIGNLRTQDHGGADIFGWMTREMIDSYSITPMEGIIIAVFYMFTLLLLTPLGLGMARWHFALVRSENPPLSEAFHFYESGSAYLKAIWYDINIGVRSFLWAALCYSAPCAVLFASVYYLAAKEDLARTASAVASTGIFLSAVMFFLASLFYAAVISRYTLVPFLLGESDEMTVSKAVKTSIRYTKGFRFSIVWFGFSFSGWILLAALFLPLLVYVVPYIQTSAAMYSRYIIEKNRIDRQENATCEFDVNNGAASISADEIRQEKPEI